MSEQDRINKLLESGAVKEKREDRHGDTKSGWWLDGVYLGNDTRTALESIG
jgi:hypothetical protein